jgi:hypothetical protein
MKREMLPAWAAAVGLLTAGPSLCAGDQNQSALPADSPESRAVGFLATEVPRWRREHACYSCHNNGDAARALIAARRSGYNVGTALDDTLSWLQRPELWDGNATDGGVDDKPLASIQFAGALASAVEAGTAPSPALQAAAAMVASHQRPDGSWTLDSSQGAGTPATYGTALATWVARRTLVSSGDDGARPAIERADRWLRAFTAENVLDSAAVVLALSSASDEAGRIARENALAVLLRAQAPDGGWGLYETSSAEPFDTAVALLALVSADGSLQANDAQAGGQASATAGAAPYREPIARGRAYLITSQQPDGSWPETTRPPGQESYAQRMSTAAWATLALLATAEASVPPRQGGRF